MSPVPDRVRVTSTHTSAGRPGRRSVASEIDAQTQVGEIYVRSLIRTQLRLAIGVLLLLAASVGMLPLLFTLAPATRSVALLGIPLPWLLLGGVVYPFLICLAWFYVRRAERNERAFHDLVGPR
ncbi:MAG: hypothetical protein M3Y66_09905 [Actinomycetota bacterium]|nr:hypothetical protein [Actinomycetota bacterium]